MKHVHLLESSITWLCLEIIKNIFGIQTMQKKKMRQNILLIKIKDCMVFVHVLRKLQVKIFLNSANVHFQNKGKDLSY